MFFTSLWAVGFWKVLVRNSKGLCCGRFGLGKLTQQKKLQRRGRPCNVRNPWHSEGGGRKGRGRTWKRKNSVQSSSRALADKGWPGRWHHSTPLCSPMQGLCFDLNSFASMFYLFLSCPPPSLCHGFLTLHFDFASPGPCPGRRPQALACFKYIYI